MPPVSNQVDEARFLERFAPVVYNVALRLVGNPSDAEDLAQDALIRALKGLQSFRGDSQLSTWVYRVTVNTWKNRVRSEKRRGFWKTVTLNIFTGEDEDEEPGFPADEPALDSGLETEERARCVHKALMELDAESRAVVVLRELEGQAYQDIASALDIPEGTVKSRLSRARGALKEKLRKHMAL